MPWVAHVARLAIAASVLLVVAAGVRYWSSFNAAPQAIKPQAPQQMAIVDVTGPSVEPAAGPAVNEITIGPAGTLTQAQAAFALCRQCRRSRPANGYCQPPPTGAR